MKKYENYLYRILPQAVMSFGKKYFRLEVEGLEHVPRRGPALIVPNHSGFAGLDALMLSYELFNSVDRVPRVLTHKAWFQTPLTTIPANKVGFVKASTDEGLRQLKKQNLVVIFPEGEHGNFKPSIERYRLQKFKTGFVRMAIKASVPIIPTLILGAEESNLNILKLKGLPGGITLPLPLNLIPLPARWKIIFLPPVEFPYLPDAVDDSELMDELAEDMQERMQTALSAAAASRKNIY